jgi:TPR repeat protein
MASAVLRFALLAASLALAAPGFAAEDLKEAMGAYSRGDYLRAVQLLLPLAQRGDAEAQTRLGLMYFNGQGVREDDDAAFDWIRRAALQGHARAQYHLGNLYAFDHGVPREEKDADRMAARWYFESAQQGNADAQYALGLLFLSGKGVVQDAGEARRWFTRAANAGHAEARRFLADFTAH